MGVEPNGFRRFFYGGKRCRNVSGGVRVKGTEHEDDWKLRTDVEVVHATFVQNGIERTEDVTHMMVQNYISVN